MDLAMGNNFDWDFEQYTQVHFAYTAKTYFQLFIFAYLVNKLTLFHFTHSGNLHSVICTSFRLLMHCLQFHSMDLAMERNFIYVLDRLISQAWQER
jgi:hypothetical protein